MLKDYWQLARPRTFPLAVASIVCGTGIAHNVQPHFTAKHWLVFALTLFVALSLQILSNMANDYGDGIKGTDSHRHAHSPKRLTVQGQLNLTTLKRAIFLWALMTLCCGVGLLWLGFDSLGDFLLFLAFGIAAIMAAMAYTMGKRPYGYRAMGEVAVLLFFGWLGVLGSAYLQLQYLQAWMWLPATGCGLLSACVLYVNNMRDIDSDRKAHKTTLAVLLGNRQMFLGYWVMMFAAWGCYALASLIQPQTKAWHWLWVLALPLLIKHLKQIHKARDLSEAADTEQSQTIGNELKIIVMMTLVLNVLYAIGINI